MSDDAPPCRRHAGTAVHTLHKNCRAAVRSGVGTVSAALAASTACAASRFASGGCAPTGAGCAPTGAGCAATGAGCAPTAAGSACSAPTRAARGCSANIAAKAASKDESATGPANGSAISPAGVASTGAARAASGRSAGAAARAASAASGRWPLTRPLRSCMSWFCMRGCFVRKGVCCGSMGYQWRTPETTLVSIGTVHPETPDYFLSGAPVQSLDVGAQAGAFAPPHPRPSDSLHRKVTKTDG